MDKLLEINNLTKVYGERILAVNNLSITLPKGKIIGLLGPNGSGKTTLIKLIAGVLHPTEGTILIDGDEVGKKTKGLVSYLPDRNHLNEQEKISNLLKFYEEFYEDFSRERAEKMMQIMDIDLDRPMKHLSKGSKEKIQLAFAMSRDAKLYLLDEPIAGVDPAARSFIIQTIITNYNPEATVLISTHLISEVEQILDEVIFMHKGRALLYTSVDNIREEYGKSVDGHFREVFAC